MANLKVPTIPTALSLRENLGHFKEVPTIRWSETEGGQESEAKIFSAGRNTRWECNMSKGLYADDIWGDDASDGFQMSVQDRSGGSWLTTYLDLDISRQFGVFNSLGFQFYQTGGNLKGAIYLHKVGREYKKPGTGQTWSYSDADLDDEFYNERGTFFHMTDFSSDEISQQKKGYILNRIYFNYGTSTKGSTGTGSAPYTDCHIYNLKLGWGEGEASDNHRICLPKIRPFDQAAQLQFG